jgi:hypothetical protein
MADHLEDDFVPDELVALSEEIDLGEAATSWPSDEEVQQPVDTQERKRKRKAKLKERRAKVWSTTWASVCN